MSSKKLNWGIVSTGRIALQFASDLPHVENANLYGVAARSIDKAESFAQQLGVAKTYNSYQAMFDDPKIDVVYIGTPHTLHFEQTVAALKAGKHVLCEKPITTSSEQSQKLASLAKDKGLVLMEAMWTYFLPAILEVKKWVDEGRIGKVLHLKAEFGYPIKYDPSIREYDAELAGGCLLDMGIYPIAMAGLFLGYDDVDWQVDAHLAPNGVDDDVIYHAKFGEAKASLHSSFRCKLMNYLEVIGDKGTISVKDYWRADSATLFDIETVVEKFEDSRATLGFEFEAFALGQAILAKKGEVSEMPHSVSYWLQQQMEKIKAKF